MFGASYDVTAPASNAVIMCVGNRCVSNEELIEGIVMFVTSFLVFMWSLSKYSRSSFKPSKTCTDRFLSDAICWWGLLFIAAHLVVMVFQASTLPLGATIFYLAISTFAVASRTSKHGSKTFVLVASCSWYGLFALLIGSRNGSALEHLLSFDGLLALYCYTAVVPAGHLVEKDVVEHLSTTLFTVAGIICLWLSMIPVQLCILQILPGLTGSTEENPNAYYAAVAWFLESATAVPERFKELKIDEYFRVLVVVIMLVFHVVAHFVIHSVDDAEDPQPLGTSNEGEGKKLPVRELEELNEEERGIDKQLPADAVKLTYEEAVSLQERALKSRKKKS